MAFKIRTKMAAVMAMGFVVVFTVIFIQVARNERELGLQHESKSEALLLELLAAQLSAPLQARDEERISQIYQPVVDKDPGLAMITVEHADGEALSSYTSRTIANPEFQSLLTQATAAARESGAAQTRARGFSFASAVPIFASDGTTLLGVVAIARDYDVALSGYREKTNFALVLSTLVAFFGLIIVVLIFNRMVQRPLAALGGAMGAVGRGHYQVEIPGNDRLDEIGKISDELSVLRDTLSRENMDRKARQKEADQRQKMFHRLAEHLSRLAKGEVDCPIDEAEFSDLDEDHLAICRNFNSLLNNLHDVLATATVTAETVRNSSREISEVAADQSQRSESQAATLEESAAAIEELNASVQQTAEHAADADRRITENKRQAETGGEVVGLTVSAMKSIEESSQQITDIIGVIDDIAFQTNLLALNAGVEAARAGDAGRGFAVVASEVRALAQRASDSANEIKELIMRSSEQVTQGSALAGKAGVALNDIIEGVNHVSQLVSRIATGSREQANNLAEIKESIGNLDRVTQQNAAVIEESSAASRSLSDEAERMTEVLGAFRLRDVDDWQTSVAAKRPNDPEDWTREMTRVETARPWPDAAKTADQTVHEPVLTISARSRAGDIPVKQAVNADEGWDEF